MEIIMSIQNINKREKYKGILILGTSLLFTSSLAYGSELECQAGVASSTLATMQEEAQKEIKNDFEYYKKMEKAATVRKVTHITTAIAVPALGITGAILAVIPEPSGGTKIAGGVVGASALAVGAGGRFIESTFGKREEKYREALSFHPTQEAITLERKLMHDMRKEDKAKIKEDKIVQKNNLHQSQLKESGSLKRLGRKVQLKFEQIRLNGLEKKLGKLNSHKISMQEQLAATVKEKAQNFDQNDAVKFHVKYNLLQQQDFGMTGYYEPYRKIRQEEYLLLLDELSKQRS
jgi:hypothetical protein